MENENPAGIVLKKARESGLVISRIPKETRDIFVKIAEESFADDYGLLLKNLLDQALEYQQMKAILFYGLHEKIDKILECVDKDKEKVDEDGQKTIKLLNGRIVKGGKNKDE